MKIYSILIGCSMNNIYGSENDVDFVCNVIKKFQIINNNWQDPVIIKGLIDMNKSNIIEKINSVLRLLNHDDKLLFYYSGHGLQKPNQDEKELDNLDEYIPLANNLILTDNELADIFKNIHNTAVYIFDCCKSGGFDDIIKYNNNRDAFLLISACQENEFSRESFAVIDNSNQNKIIGAFTYNFFSLLTSKFNTDNTIHFSDIKNEIDIDHLWKLNEILGQKVMFIGNSKLEL